ncbi:MAG TPA: universal stress protein [Polyangiales bacterium]
MAFKKILVALDFSEPSARALRLAHELAKAAGAQLEVVHVHPELYDGRGNAELGLPWPNAGQEERYLRFLVQEIRGAIDNTVGPTVEAHIEVTHGDPVKRVLAMVEQRDADLLCVGSTGKGGVQRALLGSVSQSLLRSSPVPVLVVH